MPPPFCFLLFALAFAAGPFFDRVDLRPYAGDPCLDGRVVCADHYEDQHDSICKHSVVCELSECLRQNGQQCSGNDASPDISYSAEYDEYQNQYRCVEVEFDRYQSAVVESEQAACHSGESRTDDKCHKFILSDIQSDGLTCDTVVSDGHDSTSLLGVLQVEHDENGEQAQQQTPCEGCHCFCPGSTDGSGDDPVVVLYAFDSVIECESQTSVTVESEVKDVHEVPYDLTESKCYDRQIVASESQDRDTDDESGN